MKKMLLMLALVAGCFEVDMPLPVDGQVYLCTALDQADGHAVFQVERCGPWDDWRPAAEGLDAELNAEGLHFDIDCRGTQKPCSWEPAE